MYFKPFTNFWPYQIIIRGNESGGYDYLVIKGRKDYYCVTYSELGKYYDEKILKIK